MANPTSRAVGCDVVMSTAAISQENHLLGCLHVLEIALPHRRVGGRESFTTPLFV